MLKALVTSFVAAAASFAVHPAARAQQGDSPIVFAAASLKNALDAALEDYGQATGRKVTVSYAASSALAKQIEAGAPADIFFSADLEWMNYLSERDLIAADTGTTLLGNTLVLVAPADSKTAVTITPGMDLAAALDGGKLAMAAVNSVPAGKYGKAALEKLGAWAGVSAQVAEAENVRSALAFVARGEAPLGIVYATDARAEPAVKVLAAFPEDLHPPILYPVALTKGSDAEARAVLDHLLSPEAKARFEAQGFRFLATGS
jgi:molybdate transport system substrate-binding protein